MPSTADEVSVTDAIVVKVSGLHFVAENQGLGAGAAVVRGLPPVGADADDSKDFSPSTSTGQL